MISSIVHEINTFLSSSIFLTTLLHLNLGLEDRANIINILPNQDFHYKQRAMIMLNVFATLGGSHTLPLHHAHYYLNRSHADIFMYPSPSPIFASQGY